ncbi:DNA repair protein XRCC3 homolog OS=Arabidopsis thaliana GN=XRCC3 PE=1 SV=1 [Rhizoctonia solani AG-1 IB]|uniref:DNA repair protein XRCC3 homolog n=1 Tax=Thanatephorus cucumeris (strain AG1-IB / isolate 7/3/14) TaxID=1108050 RepID=A0A0B7FDS1_THACB|nr:DNA repair protein XRCC3 homolog OS=Arabidopsis thaliana GN=XRCC3 PE=1 SV=1 [Rhizoctonia solani AG-1 IB]
MDLPTIAQVPELPDQTKNLLTKANLKNYIDVVTLSASDLATKLRVPLEKAQTILQQIHSAFTPETHVVKLGDTQESAKHDLLGSTFTTGDDAIDNLLGGGFTIGQVHEITGEAASGKSQLALQLALTVQLPESERGLNGSALYLTTLNRLITSRLLEMASSHPVLSAHESTVSLDNIATQHAPDVDKLTVLLTALLPIHATTCRDRGHPLRLLVIDSMTALFRDRQANQPQNLYARSESLNAVGALLHQIASAHELAVVVLNDVTDVFAANPTGGEADHEIIYKEQSRWFARAGGVAGEERHEAALGMVWSNHLNSRMLLARTGRRRHIEGSRVRRQGEGEDSEAVLIRRAFLLFGRSVEDEVPAPSLDFIIDTQGIISVS